MKKREKKIDKLISELIIIDGGCNLKNCNIYSNIEAEFAIIISKSGKKFALSTAGKYNRFRGFDGCILVKYNISVYLLLQYMIQMKMANQEEY